MLDNSFPPSIFCHSCEEKLSDHVTSDNWFLCDDCFNNETTKCLDCEDIICGTIAIYNDDDNNKRCQSCYNEFLEKNNE